MDRLMIIADDVTGGLDTGVCFSKAGIKTRVNLPGSDYRDLNDAADVEVFVLETRHIRPEEAYREVYDLVAEKGSKGFTHFYKKTDSALRGNPGAELAAMRDALGAETVNFLPSYPEMNRLTVGGIHYIDGKPVSESVFGADPFNPVKESDVKVLLSRQDRTGKVTVYDSGTQEDLMNKGRELLDSGETVFAGCAGFAEVLAQLLDIEKSENSIKLKENKLCVLCGSVNPVSLKQCDTAENNGIPRTRLIQGTVMAERSEELTAMLSENGCALMNTGGIEYSGADMPQKMREVAAAVAETGSKVLRSVPDTVLFFIGGDTLLAFLKEEGAKQIIPHTTGFPGTVLTTIRVDEKEVPILSKSGGFGETDLILRIYDRIRCGLEL